MAKKEKTPPPARHDRGASQRPGNGFRPRHFGQAFDFSHERIHANLPFQGSRSPMFRNLRFARCSRTATMTRVQPMRRAMSSWLMPSKYIRVIARRSSAGRVANNSNNKAAASSGFPGAGSGPRASSMLSCRGTLFFSRSRFFQKP